MRRWMLPAGLGLCMASLAFWLMMTAPFPAAWSARGAVAATLPGVPLGWALAAGIGAADGVMVVRSSGAMLLEVMPSRLRVRFALRRATGITVGALSGLTLAILAGLVFAAVHGSWPTLAWSVLVQLVVAGGGFWAAACAGWLVGAATRAWALVPLLPVAAFAAVALHAPGADAVTGIFVGSASSIVVSPVSVRAAVGTAGFVVGLGALATGLLVRWAGHQTTAFGLALPGAAMMIGGVVAAFGVAPFAPPVTTGWPCQSLDTGSVVCITPDQRRDLSVVATGIGDIDERLVQVAGGPVRWLSEAGQPAFGRDRTVTFALPFGAPFDEATQVVTAVGGLSYCASIDEDVDVARQASDDAMTLMRWLDPDYKIDPGLLAMIFDGEEPPPPTREEATDAWRNATAVICEPR